MYLTKPGLKSIDKIKTPHWMFWKSKTISGRLQYDTYSGTFYSYMPGFTDSIIDSLSCLKSERSCLIQTVTEQHDFSRLPTFLLYVYDWIHLIVVHYYLFRLLGCRPWPFLVSIIFLAYSTSLGSSLHHNCTVFLYMWTKIVIIKQVQPQKMRNANFFIVKCLQNMIWEQF